jgi:Flp pilus assembly protein TadG
MGARIRHAGRVLTLPRSRREQGASLVEFAILLPLFMMLVLGMFSGGVAYNRQIALRNAAREGARWGATLKESAPSWGTTVRDVVVERSEGELEAADVCVALVNQDLGEPAGTIADAPSTHVVGNQPGQAYCFADTQDTGPRVQVRVNAEARIEALVLSYPLDLEAEATAKHEGLAASSG